MSTLTDVNSFINSLDSQAAAWYSGVSGTPVVVPATSAQQAAANALALQQQAQANLIQTNPTLAGLLSNPVAIVIVFAVVGLLIYMVVK